MTEVRRSRSLSRSLLRAPLALAALVALVAGARAAELEPKIVNGLPTQEFGAVGALLAGSDPSTADSLCSGTLIGCSTFLTAAHCVCAGSGAQCQPPNAPNPTAYKVYLAHGGLFSVESITVRPDFSFPVGDLAIVKLAKPVNGIRPAEINTVAAPPFGSAGLIVGFGRSGGTSFDYGLKRYGAVTTGPCPFLVSPTTSVCWTFEAPIGEPGADSNTCSADSGGPLFVDQGAGPQVAGVASGGTSDDCLPTDQSYDANVFTYRSWVIGTGGADLEPATCGALPPVGDAGTESIAWDGTVSYLAPEARNSVEVPAGASLLRVAMNAVDDGLANFDLYVKRGAPPTPTSFDCARTGSAQFGVCDFSLPAAGTWHLLVRRVAGSGAFQVSATRFGASALDAEITVPPGPFAPGDALPFALAIDNGTEVEQRFALVAVLAAPGGETAHVIPARGLALAPGGRFETSLSLPLPADASLGVYTLGAALWQPGAGLVERSIRTFEVR